MISTRHLGPLPDVEGLRRLSQSLALLDAILSPEWEDRYYSFDSRWHPAAGEAMASMRNGQGDGYFILFTPAGAIAKGFAHEAPMAPAAQEQPRVWPGVLHGVPETFASFLAEPAFQLEETTFCIWRRSGDPTWQRGEVAFPADADPDGSAALLSVLDAAPDTYRSWAEDYYERPIDPEAVARIYAHEPLTQDLVAALNPDSTLEDLAEDLDEIGYPTAGH
jgi:hypothetical protein